MSSLRTALVKHTKKEYSVGLRAVSSCASFIGDRIDLICTITNHIIGNPRTDGKHFILVFGTVISFSQDKKEAQMQSNPDYAESLAEIKIGNIDHLTHFKYHASIADKLDNATEIQLLIGQDVHTINTESIDKIQLENTELSVTERGFLAGIRAQCVLNEVPVDAEVE